MTCLACRGRLPAFVDYGDPPRPGLCPRCGAKPRHRALLLFLARFVAPRLGTHGEVLDIGPSRGSTRFMPQRWAIGGARYTAVDLDRRPAHRLLRPPHRFLLMDAGRMRFRDGTFDVILCNNVLGFAPNDRAILAEIRRCLKPDGVAMVDVDVQVRRTTPSEVLRRRDPRRFNETYVAGNGSFRFYGRDYPSILRAAGLVPLRVDPLTGVGVGFRRTHGLKRDAHARVYLAFRTPAAAAALASRVERGSTRRLMDLDTVAVTGPGAGDPDT